MTNSLFCQKERERERRRRRQDSTTIASLNSLILLLAYGKIENDHEK